MPDVLLRDGTTRHGFLATLGSRTWRPRAVAASALADLEAVASRGSYAAWLRRTSTAWSCLPLAPVDADGGPLVTWPLRSVGAEVLDGRAELAADLRDLAVAGGGVVGLPGRRPAPAQEQPADDAFLVGAAYVAMVAAADAAVLTGAALSLAEATTWAPVGTRFLQRCRRLAPARHALQAELAAWAASAGPEAADRAVLTARTLTLELAQALQHTRSGW
ncbi:MAG TPA: hypothetical protein VE781_16455 [Kineosporiaceae bacterium]|nr:hypothetical protein [Kineosporiaceae bacterium]